jgi:hypothetical protein
LAVGLSLALAGCSDSGGTQNDGKAGGDIGVFPDLGSACGAGIYPCGPYGTRTNETLGNMAFQGIMDPNELCIKHSLKKHDDSQVLSLSFKDYHLGSPKAGCGSYKKQLLLVMVSSGWCGPCKAEVSQVAGWITKDQVDSRMAVVDILVDNNTPGSPADPTFVKTWSSTYGITFPVVMDPSFRMGKFFTRSAVPFNMLIDLRTMEIFFTQVGANFPNIEKKIKEFKFN